MRVYPLAFLVLLCVLFAPGAVFADEVELHSGAVFVGRIEKETETEVVIDTELGKMTFARSAVKEIRKTSGESPADPAAASAAEPFDVSGLDPTVAPVVAVDTVFAVKKDGHVAAWTVAGGKPLWTSDAGKGTISGLAADPGGLYVVTNDGMVARLSPRNGSLVWLSRPGVKFEGSPLIHRRRIYAFQPNIGLIGIESANGSVKSRFGLRVEPGTVLTAAGASIVFGTTDGTLMSLAKDGSELGGVVETGTPFSGHAVATWRRTGVIALKEELVAFDAERQKLTRKVPVPGLVSHPFACDSTRAYVEFDGALAAMNLVNGRIAWRCFDLPRVIAMTISGSTIFATTADDTVAAVSLPNGRLLWSLPLGSRPASAPIPTGKGALVLTADGRAKIYVGTATPAPKPGPAAAPATGPVHSPDGYRLDAPTGWALSESITRGAVSLGFRPISDAPHFARSGAREQDRKLLEVSAYLTVSVVPTPAVSAEDLMKIWVDEAERAAEAAGHGLEKTAKGEVSFGGAKWSRVRVLEVIPDDMLKGTFERIALFRKLDDRQTVWVDLRVPSRYAKAGIADMESLAASLKAEKAADFRPTPDVATAEAAVAALGRNDLTGFAALLSEPLKTWFSGSLITAQERKIRLVARTSRALGRRRVVRLRIDSQGGTTFTGLTLAKERDRWVIIHLGALMQ